MPPSVGRFPPSESPPGPFPPSLGRSAAGPLPPVGGCLPPSAPPSPSSKHALDGIDSPSVAPPPAAAAAAAVPPPPPPPAPANQTSGSAVPPSFGDMFQHAKMEAARVAASAGAPAAVVEGLESVLSPREAGAKGGANTKGVPRKPGLLKLKAAAAEVEAAAAAEVPAAAGGR